MAREKLGTPAFLRPAGTHAEGGLASGAKRGAAASPRGTTCWVDHAGLSGSTPRVGYFCLTDRQAPSTYAHRIPSGWPRSCPDSYHIGTSDSGPSHSDRHSDALICIKCSKR